MPYKTCLHHNSIPFDQEWWRVTSNRNVSDSMSYEPFSKTNFRISDNTVSILEMMNNLFCKSRWWSKMECFTNWFEVGFRCGKCHRFVYGSSDPMDYGDHRVFHKSSKGLNVVSFVLVFVFSFPTLLWKLRSSCELSLTATCFFRSFPLFNPAAYFVL